MSSTKKPMRYAHCEGHVDMCYDETGKHLLTCGCDGDVRKFEGLEDDDPVTHRVGDVVYAIACKNERFYTATDDNTIRAHTLSEGDADGIVTRFTAPATHITFNHSGSRLIAGASDFTVKIVEVESSEQSTFQGHTAPILSVALNPRETYLASSSCDGTVRVWSVSTQEVVKTITGLPKTNDFGSTKTLCRLAWDKEGKYLAVPMGCEVQVFETDTWELAFSLTDDSIKEMLSIVCFTPCGSYLAASSHDGAVVVWHFKSRKQVALDSHEKRLTITALAWNPSGSNELAFCDNHGNLAVMENLLPGATEKVETSGTLENENQLTDDIFDDDNDDDMLLEASNRVTPGDGDDASSDDEASIGKIKKRYSQMIQDEDSRDPDAETKLADEAGEIPVAAVAPPILTPTYEPTPLQPPFQSSSTPVHLAHRFMVWNSVGIIIQYNTEEENSINVEFHDTATHHALHVVNTLGHTMADLSSEAVLLACPSDLDNPSTLVCVNFASQDNHKEWSTSMPHGEDIKTICVGDGWVAVATDKRQVRLFTVGGVQRELFSLPGPVVTMTAFGSQLMVVYHSGLGLPGDQCLGVHLLQMTSRRKALIHGGQLPISPKSTLTWLGFSAEGTPVSVDSVGVVRMLNRDFCQCWVQVANTKTQCKGKSDHFWVVGVLENPQQLRAVLCKGSRFPPTLPRPTVLLLPFQLPLCDLSTDKGSLEETFWRSSLFSNHLDWWTTQGYEVDAAAKMNATIPQQEALMKLFALSCRTERESRAVELCRLMPSQHTVQLAIKYASRLHLLPLAQRLNDIARTKAEEEVARQQEDDEEEEDFRDALDAGHSHTATEWGHTNGHSHSHSTAQERGEGAGGMEVDGSGVDTEEEGDQKASGPMLTLKSKKPTKETPKSLLNSQEARKNPFKVASQKTATPARGSSVFDSLEKVKSGSRLTGTGRSPVENLGQKKKDKSQPKLFAISKKVDKVSASKDKPVKQVGQGKTSGFQVWLGAHREDLREESPDLSEADLTVLAARRYKGLTSEEKQEWVDKAVSGVDGAVSATPAVEEDGKKRKREETEAETGMKAVKTADVNGNTAGKKTTRAKLSSFSFGKN